MPAPVPFVLLDDARPGGAAARLYRDPAEIIVARDVAGVLPALGRVRAGTARGLHAAGWIGYEAAAAFEPRLPPPVPAADALPLLWFGLFAGYEAIAAADLPGRLPDPAGAWLGEPQPAIARADYDAQLAAVLALIDAGDLYQANLTFQAQLPFQGDPLALYARLRAHAGAGHGAFIASGDHHILSLSPELFFALENRQLSARPMKGTAPRGDTPEADRAAAEALAADPKQRAENLMIVDLMRNDLARVAEPGSVAVPALFTVERYPTVHQLVSEVRATLAPGRDAVDVIAALFPCGSVTGAPKMRAIEALSGIEQGPRGLYTGAIGRIDPGGDAMFNVAIRTLVARQGAGTATLGLGGGIVADSRAASEWEETRAKAAFIRASRPRFDLIETMAFDPLHGLLRLDAHVARMRASAAQLGFAFDRHAARNELQAATFKLRSAARVRLLLAPSGALAVEVSPMPPALAGIADVALAPLPVAHDDFRLRHKTSDRAFYDEARVAAGSFEVAFTDPHGFLTEGSFTALFVERGGRLLTPPLARGLLPGVLREALIAEGRAEEADLRPDDLAEGFLIGNSLRGLMPARLVARGGAATL